MEPEEDLVNHPSHYKGFSVETIDMMISIYGQKQVAMYCEINAFKYRMRMGSKNNNSVQQDFDKSEWYLNKAKELRLNLFDTFKNKL